MGCELSLVRRAIAALVHKAKAALARHEALHAVASILRMGEDILRAVARRAAEALAIKLQTDAALVARYSAAPVVCAPVEIVRTQTKTRAPSHPLTIFFPDPPKEHSSKSTAPKNVVAQNTKPHADFGVVHEIRVASRLVDLEFYAIMPACEWRAGITRLAHRILRHRLRPHDVPAAYDATRQARMIMHVDWLLHEIAAVPESEAESEAAAAPHPDDGRAPNAPVSTDTS